MASIEVTGFEATIQKLTKLSNQSEVEKIAMKAVTAAQPISEAAMKSAVASVEYGPYSTGSVSGSISSTPTKVNGYGVYAVAKPNGRDKNSVWNGEKAAYLEYGTPRTAARPWRARAINSAEGPAIKAMEEVVKAEMELDT